MKRDIHVVIAHRYKILNETLRMALAETPRLSMMGQVSSASEVLALLANQPVDVLLLDPFFEDRDSLEVARECLLSHKKLSIIAFLLDPGDWRLASRYMKAGAKGCLTMESHLTEMQTAIHRVFKGNAYMPHQLQQTIMEKYVFLEDSEEPEKSLSNREFQVMKLLAAGKTNAEISQSLFIAIKTVDTHRANLLKKLNLRNNADIARFAIAHGFIRLP